MNAIAFFQAFGPVAGANPQNRLVVGLDELPQSKMVIKPTQLADIEASHLYGRHIVSEVTNMEVEPWAIFLLIQPLGERDVIQLAI